MKRLDIGVLQNLRKTAGLFKTFQVNNEKERIDDSIAIRQCFLCFLDSNKMKLGKWTNFHTQMPFLNPIASIVKRKNGGESVFLSKFLKNAIFSQSANEFFCLLCGKYFQIIDHLSDFTLKNIEFEKCHLRNKQE